MSSKLKWFHRVRLNRFADKLAGEGAYARIGPVPPHKFDMRYMYQEKQGGRSIVREDFDPHHCNTTACALGWALTDPWFLKHVFKDRTNSITAEWGLHLRTYKTLFYNHAYTQGRGVSPQIVAACLRRVAAS